MTKEDVRMKKIIRIGIGPVNTTTTNTTTSTSIDVNRWYDIELIPDEEDGGFTVRCLSPGLTGAISEGETEDEAIMNIREAIHAIEESLADEKRLGAPL